MLLSTGTPQPCAQGQRWERRVAFWVLALCLQALASEAETGTCSPPQCQAQEGSGGVTVQWAGG